MSAAAQNKTANVILRELEVRIVTLSTIFFTPSGGLRSIRAGAL
jgi:hypothetical protein